MAVRDEIAHILLHVEAEAKESDPSQTPGVAGRAQRVRVALESFKTDDRKLGRQQLLAALIRETGDSGLKGELNAIDKDDDGEKIRLSLQEWVGQGTRGNRGR